MDVFEKVQEIRPEIEGDDENLVAARMLLLKEIRAERRPARSRASRRPLLVAAGALGAAAAVVAGVLVVTNLTVPVQAPIIETAPTREPNGTITRTPTPAPVASTGPEVLQGAAIAAAGFAPPVLAPGQYLRRSWTEEVLGVYDPSLDSGGEPGYSASRAAATSGWVIRRSGAEYAQPDLHAPWYREWGAPEVLSVFGDQAEAQEQLDSVLAAYGTGHPLYESEVPSLPEGGGENILWYFDTMPRDPAAMIAWIKEHQGDDAAGWVEGKVGWLLIALLSYNVGDPEMRAAMYQALSLLSGSTVSVEQNGVRTVTFDSHLGSSESSATSLTRFTITIEMATGIVRESTTTSSVGEGMIPADVPDTRMTYEMSVVDELP